MSEAIEALFLLIGTIGGIAFVFAILGAISELCEKVSDAE